MAEKTTISWTEHTWNPWVGCTKISPGCKNCYMFRDRERFHLDPRQAVRTKTWKDPQRWQKAAEAAGRQEQVFTCSWSDWFHQDADDWRPEAWEVVRHCPNLIFQILTKRPERIREHLPGDWGAGYPNVWLGVSIESNAYTWRADLLREVDASVRFISAEPLLEPLDKLSLDGIDWLIVGGESGDDFRPMDHQWARDLLAKARLAGTAFYFKQSAAPKSEMGIELDGQTIREYPQPGIVTAQCEQFKELARS
jgi:protein gp37